MTHVDPSGSEATGSRRCCAFTIVSRNYLHYAFNLMASVAVHLPQARRVIVLCDAADGTQVPAAGIELIGIEALGTEHLDRLVVQYTILELNTAIKPFAFAHLFAAADVEAVVYFDPDIQLFSSGSALLQRLQTSDVVLTPHLTAPLDDDRQPTDLSILQSGTYNLGFLALRRSAATAGLLRWWQDKLRRDCVVDIPRGLFTDQKWMDLVPGFVEHTHVERHPGWNVAYWNLRHRQVTSDAAGFQVNGQPLFFFHFSGYSPGSRWISKHQDRYTLDDCGPAVRTLFSQYVERLDAFGRAHWSSKPYGFGCLADGTPLPEAARRVIRTQLDWSLPLPDLASPAGVHMLVRLLTEPVDHLRPALSRLALQVHRARPDLQLAFADVLGTHRQAFADWFRAHAGDECGIVGVLAGVDREPTPPADALAAEPIAAAQASAGVEAVSAPLQGPYRLAYRLVWKARHLLRPLSTPAMRNRLREHLVRRAYPPTPVAAAPLADPPPFGVTVIGYVKAESGVGESARATLRALARSGLPHALEDFRGGNVSRMGEQVDERLASGRRYAVSLLHVNADQLSLARTLLGEAAFQVPYRIAYWAWELENFPAEWHGAFAHVDEVWVPSAFCQQAIGAAAPVPVLCLPHSVEVPALVSPDRARFGLRESSFACLAMADMMSSDERKNPMGALRAFAAAFPGGRADAELVVKISNGARAPEALAALQSLAAATPGVHLIADYLDRPALNSLIDSVDCFISLHRSEGFGLVIAEAMARGKVVVATGWSGNMDFMSSHNALPVAFELRAIEADVGPYRRGERWAEPALGDAVRLLRLAASDLALRERLGRQARQDIERLLSPAVIGRRMADRLQVIRARKSL
mgnify:CR=1 FL=1